MYLLDLSKKSNVMFNICKVICIQNCWFKPFLPAVITFFPKFGKLNFGNWHIFVIECVVLKVKTYLKWTGLDESIWQS